MSETYGVTAETIKDMFPDNAATRIDGYVDLIAERAGIYGARWTVSARAAGLTPAQVLSDTAAAAVAKDYVSNKVAAHLIMKGYVRSNTAWDVMTKEAEKIRTDFERRPEAYFEDYQTGIATVSTGPTVDRRIKPPDSRIGRRAISNRWRDPKSHF